MFLRRIKFDVLSLSFGGLTLLLLLAAVFMHRWINRISTAEYREKYEQLESALANTRKDFLGVLRDIPDFNSEAKTPAQMGAWITGQHQRWRTKTPHPNLISQISAGQLLPQAQVTFAQLAVAAEKENTLQKIEWPEKFASFKTELITRAKNKTLQPLPPEAQIIMQNAGQLLIVQPLTASVAPQIPKPYIPPARKQSVPELLPPRDEPPFRRPPPGQMPGRRPPMGEPPPFVRQRWEEQRKRMEEQQERVASELQKERQDAEKRVQAATQALRKDRPRIEQLGGFVFLELQPTYLQETILPQLIAQHFKASELANYQIEVVSDNGQPFFPADNNATALTHYDGQEILWQSEVQSWRGEAPNFVGQTLFLRAHHKAGSLEKIVQQTRRRNLLIGYGVLLALFASAISLLVATARARALAQRQIEFVAGVTHELRTPLTAIQAAGFNLSSGRVNDQERVKQYGSMIHSEGKRLSDLIDQVLSYARIETAKKSGEAAYNFQPVAIESIIAQAWREYEPMFTGAGWTIEKDIAADLPLLEADANILASAIKNLLQNALKYAGQGKWLRLAAVRVNDEIQITVSDHGAGIERRDLPHIFAPFYRARKMVASNVPGTGLGLSLVQEYLKAHRGRVSVQSVLGKGTTFTLHLPLLAANEKKS